MVQKYQSPVRVYKHPFELLMRAYEMRFPTCDMIPVVKETEIIDEHISEDGSVHTIDRRAKLAIDVPYLLKKFMGVDHLLFRQKNTLDKRQRTLQIDAWNESFSHRVVINELCLYTVHPENPNWTCFEQSADLDIKSFFGFEGSAEKIAINEYSKNIAKSKDIMEKHICVLAEQGITHVPIWQPPVSAALAVKDGAGGKEKEEDSAAAGSAGTPVNAAMVAASPPEKKLLRRKSSGIRGDMDALHITEDTTNKLEQDYIQMYLGELTPMQESKLVQLKNRVSDLLKGKALPSDPVFLRFLRARDFNVEKAREMLSASLLWRKKHGVDKILSEYETPPPVIREYFPGGWHHHDKEGRPLFILRLGQMDVKGIVKSVGEDGLIKLTLHICEEGLRLAEEAAHRLNKPISTWCLLLDLEGLNMRHLWRPGMKALLHIIEICEANYPETLGRVLIIRAPRVFPIMWTLVSPLIDETSREKFLFYGGNDYQQPGGLVDYISPEFIPSWLSGSAAASSTSSSSNKAAGGGCGGGTADDASAIPEGGLVPKSYYMSVEEFEKDQSPGPQLLEESFYHSMSLGKGQVHEGVIHITERASVITWDFDVMRHDVVFTVYRLKAPPSASLLHTHKSPLVTPTQHSSFAFPAGKKDKEAAPTPTPTGDAKDKEAKGGDAANNASASPAVGDAANKSAGAGAASHNATQITSAEHKSCIDKSWREGVDYFRAENSVVCHDGESIQGSHVTAHTGTYVLQWKFHDAPGRDHHHHPSPLDVITPHHKAKVMYYYETLSSIDYKGSMTSLQSCQSAFSTISKASKHSTSGVSSGVSSAASHQSDKNPSVERLS